VRRSPPLQGGLLPDRHAERDRLDLQRLLDFLDQRRPGGPFLVQPADENQARQGPLCRVLPELFQLRLDSGTGIEDPQRPVPASEQRCSFGRSWALWVFNAGAGVKTELEKLWEYATERALPGLIFISGLDKEGTAWATLVEEIEKALEIKTVPLSMPIGKEASLEGVVDLLTGEAFRYASDGSGKRQKAEVPAALCGEVEDARKKLMEGAAETDDQLLEKYLVTGL